MIIYFQSTITALVNKLILEFSKPTVNFLIVRCEIPSLEVDIKIKSASFGENRTSKSLNPDGFSTGTSVVKPVPKLCM